MHLDLFLEFEREYRRCLARLMTQVTHAEIDPRDWQRIYDTTFYLLAVAELIRLSLIDDTS